MSAQKYILLFAALAGLTAVLLGAFGSHGLRPKLDAESLQNFQTGVQYQFIHALAMMAVGILMFHIPQKWLIASGYSFLAGIILFSGSLYLLATSDVTGISVAKPLVFLTPVGGLSFIGGWIFLGLAVWQSNRK